MANLSSLPLGHGDDPAQLDGSTGTTARLWWSLLLPALLCYPVLCAVLRFKRRDYIQRKYGTATQQPSARMTDHQAHEIIDQLSELEFPFMYEKALQLALFRTYGIPSIAKTVASTAQLSTTENVGKRYADTAVLVAEIYGTAPTSERSVEAFARLNYLHGHYIKQGKISNDDMLYTLALFMSSPKEYIDRYEWRTLTDVETCGLGVFHVEMARAMEIKLDVLPGSKTGWTDGIHFYRELDEWAKDYEMRFMVPNQINAKVASKTRELLLLTMPSGMHKLAGKFISAAVDERLRKAVMFEDPGSSATWAWESLMASRKWLLRYLALPRPDWMRFRLVGNEVDQTGHRFFVRYDSLPHYVKPTVWNRWGPSSWSRRILGIPLPGDKGMSPEGFRTAEVGPKSFSGRGHQEFEAGKLKVRQVRTGGCPFGMAG